ncbi:hypothetical protein J526_4537, partial [Acinetobacter baumannii 1284800]
IEAELRKKTDGTAEDKPFTRAQSNAMLEMAEKGIAELIKKQQEALGW